MPRSSDRPRPRITDPVITVKPPAARPERRQSFNAIKRPSLRPTGPVIEHETGKCPVCGGKVVEASSNREDSMGHHRMMASGFHCDTCGIKFEFVPPANFRRK